MKSKDIDTHFCGENQYRVYQWEPNTREYVLGGWQQRKVEGLLVKLAQYKSWLEELHREAEAEGGGELQAPRYWRKKRLGAWASAPRKRKRKWKRECR